MGGPGIKCTKSSSNGVHKPSCVHTRTLFLAHKRARVGGVGRAPAQAGAICRRTWLPGHSKGISACFCCCSTHWNTVCSLYKKGAAHGKLKPRIISATTVLDTIGEHPPQFVERPCRQNLRTTARTAEVQRHPRPTAGGRFTAARLQHAVHSMAALCTLALLHPHSFFVASCAYSPIKLRSLFLRHPLHSACPLLSAETRGCPCPSAVSPDAEDAWLAIMV